MAASNTIIVLSYVSCLASHAAALSFNHSDSDHHPAFSPHHDKSIGINATEFLSPVVFSVLQEEQTALGSSSSGVSVRKIVEFPNSTCYRNNPRTNARRRVDRRKRYRKQHETRRLLSGAYGRSATRIQHGGKVTSPWLEKPTVAVAGSALIGLMICAVAALLLRCSRSNRPRQSPASTQLEDDGEQIIRPQLRRGLGPREFTHGELAAGTNNFAEQMKIGRGGFGSVYRGYFNEEDRHVAIKVLSQELSLQGLKELQAELTVMSQLRHRNIVRLVGWCGRRGGLALVYELMLGGSLDTHLYNPDRHLTWPQRYKIALQLGSALRYLHTDCDQCVVHGDIKPANIMLDASLDAKLGDFGLARLVDHGAEPQTTQVVAGTVGYIDPEFVTSRRPSAESDVYSFGVVLLEIACGRRPTPSRRPDQAASAALLASVRDMYRRNVITDAADRRLDGEFDGMQMERLLVTGLWCAHHDPVQRPSVTQAVDVLRSEDADLPVVQTMGGSDEEISALEGQAYGDLSGHSSAYLDASTETEYLTTED